MRHYSASYHDGLLLVPESTGTVSACGKTRASTRQFYQRKLRYVEAMVMAEEWLAQLKAACDAGYYRTEEAVGEQTMIPWKDKTRRGSLIARLLGFTNPAPARCFQCRRIFSTMTQRVKSMQRVRCWECHRAHVLREPTIMATPRRRL
jgi:hypothetical protein